MKRWPGSLPAVHNRNRLPVDPARFRIVALAVLVADVATKSWAASNLTPRHFPHDVIGSFVRFTLAYNPGAAFGINVGAASRWFFALTSVLVVIALLRQTADFTRRSSLAAFGVPAVVGGATGNLVDRIRSHEGVVDFIDIGFGDLRFWTFNLADVAILTGAVCLIIALWKSAPSLPLAGRSAVDGADGTPDEMRVEG